MEALAEHTIAFSGLKDGTHSFEFPLGAAFFAATGEEEIEGGEVRMNVRLDKNPTLLVVDMHAEGAVNVRCDRCNAPMQQPVNGEQRQIFCLTGEDDYEDEELVTLDAGAHSVNLSHYFYECIRLALPIRHVHPEGQCDPEVERALQALSLEHEPTPDPRWAVLKDLQNKERSS